MSERASSQQLVGRGTRDAEKSKVIEFLADGRIARWAELKGLGVSTTAILKLQREEKLERVGWGTYQLAPELRHEVAPVAPDGELALGVDASLETFAEVIGQARKGVICMMSAVMFHHLTVDVPHQVWVGLKHGSYPPKIDYPPVRYVFWRDPSAMDTGIETHHINGMEVPVTNLERTVVDLYRYRRRLSDPAIAKKALGSAYERPQFDREKIRKYSRKFGVEDEIRADIQLLDMLGYSSHTLQDDRQIGLGL